MSAVITMGRRASKRQLRRQVFRTSRLLEFCSRKELVNQTGHPVEQWPLVILKELVDNAIDACEEAQTPPIISVSVNRGEITVADNGPGLNPDTIAGILDYTVRTSSREAYVSPTRGAQGNALKTIVAMPFALDGTGGRVTIEARSVAHRIEFSVDQIRQEPKISHVKEASTVRIGTRITVQWPDLACSNLAAAEPRFLQMAEDYVWLNPHVSLTVSWNGEQRLSVSASEPAWAKWRPSDPTSPHWYTPERFERLMAGYVAHEQGSGRHKTVREFITEFRGLSGTAKQKSILANTDTSGRSLADFFGNGQGDKIAIAKLLAEMQAVSRPVKPKDLGVIGKAHLAGMFKAAGALPESIQYNCTALTTDGLPQVIESAFGYCPKDKERHQVVGVNWSPAIINPFRALGPFGKSLDTILAQQRAGDQDEPIIFLLHLAHPRVEYSDRGKSSVIIDGAEAADEIAGGDDE
jgi:DNA topoisomerase VI subunit B